MPVTARLSKAFYDQFGEQVTNELVEWFNQVDLTYRTDLRTLNDTNFARFEALLDSRFARADLQLERRLNERFGEFEVRMEKRLAGNEQRSDAFERRIERRFGEFEDRMEKRLGEFEAHMEKRSGGFEQANAQLFSQAAQANEKRFSGIDHDIAEVREELREVRRAQSQQFRWMVGLWMTTTAGLLAVLATLISQG